MGLHEAGKGYLAFRPVEMKGEHPDNHNLRFMVESALGKAICALLPGPSTTITYGFPSAQPHAANEK